VIWFKQPFGGKLLLPFLKQRHERACARRFELFYDDLVARPAGKGPYSACDDNSKPFLRLELHFRECASADHGADARAVGLQAQIGVARAVMAGNLTAQPYSPNASSTGRLMADDSSVPGPRPDFSLMFRTEQRP